MKDGKPLSFGHYRWGMQEIARERARKRIDMFNAMRSAQSDDEERVREWTQQNLDEAQW